MAVQAHVAYSATVKGAGVVAGGPYYCAQGSLWAAYYNCMSPGPWTPLPPVPLLVAEARGLASAGRIDPVANLSGAPAWLFSGTQDRTVNPVVVAALRDWYAALGAKPALVADRPAGHAMVVEEGPNPCDASTSPFLDDCDYDAAGEMLKALLGPLRPPAAMAGGRLVEFSQDAFVQGKAESISMDTTGYLYVPRQCEAATCRVHVAFHGCRQGRESIGEAFVRGAGYNRWADTNRLLVLYPQAIARRGWSFSSGTFVWNPKGCWDWWGYSGADYATKSGAQLRAVKAMLDRLSAPRSP